MRAIPERDVGEPEPTCVRIVVWATYAPPLVHRNRVYNDLRVELALRHGIKDDAAGRVGLLKRQEPDGLKRPFASE